MLPFGACLYSPSAALARPVGSADGLAVLDASTVTNTDSTIITGDLDLSPGTSLTGLSNVAPQARADATTADRAFALLAFPANLTGQDPGGLRLTPAISRIDSSSQLTGTLRLDALRNPNIALFALQTGDPLRTSDGSAIRRFGGENSRLSWQVGSSTALDPGNLGPGAMEDVPEPGTVGLFLKGFLALTVYGWQSRKR